MANFLDRLFGKKEPGEYSVKTAPLQSSPEKQVIVAPPVPPLPLQPSQYLVGVCQSVGKQRDHNEDSMFSLNHVLSIATENVPVGLFIIADGMGGHQHGEVASSVAIREVAGNLVRRLYQPLFNLEPSANTEPLHEVMADSIHEAQESVVKAVPNGGTTLTAVFAVGDQVTIGHVGDSRAYFIYPDGQLQVLTRDHTLVRRLQELGQLTDKEAAVHPQRNVLYRAIGQGEPFEPDVNTHQFPHGGYLMICTDGLWGVISDPEMLKIILDSSNPTIACQHLVDAANAAGGPDNISVILVQYPN